MTQSRLIYIEYQNGNCSMLRTTESLEIIKAEEQSRDRSPARLVREATPQDIKEFLGMGGTIRR